MDDNSSQPPLVLPGAIINPQSEVQRLAFGSSNNQKYSQGFWNQILVQKPELFIFTGGAISARQVVDRPFIKSYARLLTTRDYQNFRTLVPVLAAWNKDAFDPADRKESTKAFKDFFINMSAKIPDLQSGIYASFNLGPAGRRLQFLILDLQTFQDKNSKTLLGQAQWDWLQQQLQQQADLRIVVSEMPVLSLSGESETWNSYPEEKARLLKLAEATSMHFISGGQGFAEISAQAKDRKKRFIEWSSSPLLKLGPPKVVLQNKARQGKPFLNENFGILDIDWNIRRIRGSLLSGASKPALSLETSF